MIKKIKKFNFQFSYLRMAIRWSSSWTATADPSERASIRTKNSTQLSRDGLRRSRRRRSFEVWLFFSPFFAHFSNPIVPFPFSMPSLFLSLSTSLFAAVPLPNVKIFVVFSQSLHNFCVLSPKKWYFVLSFSLSSLFFPRFGFFLIIKLIKNIFLLFKNVFPSHFILINSFFPPKQFNLVFYATWTRTSDTATSRSTSRSNFPPMLWWV